MFTSTTISSFGHCEAAEATSSSGAIVIYTSPATSDAVDGSGVATCSPISGSTFVLGDTTVYCDATDAAGNHAVQTSFKVTVVDTTSPTVGISGAPADWTNADQTATVTCTDTASGCDSSSYKIKIFSYDPTNCPTDYSQYTLASPQTISSHSWVCGAAKDNSGNTGYSSPAEFKVDEIAPTISDDYANDDVWINAATGTITLSPADTGDSGLKADPNAVKYCTGSGCDPSTGTALSSPYHLSFSTEQNTVVRYQSYDNAGSSSTVGEFIVKIDLTAPTTNDDASTTWRNSDATVTLTPSDTGGSGLANTYYCIYNSGDAACTPTTIGTSVSVTCVADSVCQKIVRYYSTDNAGNAETAHNSVVVRIDKTSPTVDAGPDKITNALFTQDATASDTGSGIASYSWTKESGPGTITFGTPDSEDTTVSAGTDGTYVIRLTVADVAGNSNYDEFTLTWDTVKPTTSDDYGSKNGVWQNSGQTITLTPSDPSPSSGLDWTRYCTDTTNSCDPAAGTGYTTPVAISTEGISYFRYASKDLAGNVQDTVSLTVKIDTTAPSGGSITYTDGYYTTASVPITYNTGTDSGSDLNTASGKIQRASATLSGGLCGSFGSFTDLVTESDGSYTDTSVVSGNCYMYQYVISDNVGNTATYTSSNVAKIDTTAPTGSIASPSENSHLKGTVTINAGASDSESGIEKVEFYYASTETKIGEDTTAPYSIDWVTTSATDGNHDIYVKVYDNAGNSHISSSVSIVVDNTPPVVTVPSDITTEATGPSGATVTFSASATDNIDGSITPTCTPDSGSTFALGTTLVTCSATDVAGNTGSASFHVTVQDTTPPVITLLGSTPVTIEVHSIYTDAGATALDNYDGDLTSSIVTVNPVNKDVVGIYIVTYDVTDSNHNVATQVTRTVHVVDTTPPVIASHDDVHAQVTSLAGAIVSYTSPTATDNYDSSVTVICTPASGSTFPFGTTTVTCNAQDAAHNHAIPKTFKVIVYGMYGFLPPAKSGSTFNRKQDSTIPLKFQLTGPDGKYITNAKIYAQYCTVSCDVETNWKDAVSTSNPTNSNLFRYSDNQYIFNLATKNLPIGTLQIRARLGDGSIIPGTITLR